MKKSLSTIVIGVMCIVCAVLLIITKSGIIPDMNLDLWTIILTIVFITILISGIIDLNWFGMFVPMGALCWMWAPRLGFDAIEGWVWIAVAILISVGFTTLFGPAPLKKKRMEKNAVPYTGDYNN